MSGDDHEPRRKSNFDVGPEQFAAEHSDLIAALQTASSSSSSSAPHVSLIDEVSKGAWNG